MSVLSAAQARTRINCLAPFVGQRRQNGGLSDLLHLSSLSVGYGLIDRISKFLRVPGINLMASMANSVDPANSDNNNTP
jgi:hypothetical protein